MIGQTISHYKILEKLGEGGMGVVYKAEDIKLKRTVALKFLPQDLTRDDEAKERFVHEAQAASALDHPNICTIYEIDETEGGQMFIAMACYEGETLKKKVSSGQLSVNSVVDIAIQVAQGLAKAHEHGIAHRDIKPANVMITKEGVAKIVDFGLAKLAGQTRITKTGATLGTVAYMSPEQARGEEVDHRADIWALGVVIYEMLTGQLPFRGDYDAAVIYSILNENPKPIADSRSDIPSRLEEIITKCLDKDASQRYQSAAEMAQDLREINHPGVSRATATTPAAQRVLRQWPWMAGLLLAAAVVITLLLRYSSTDKTPPAEISIAAMPSIAVMYFEDATGDEQTKWLARGLPHMLITSLEQCPDVRVIGYQRLYDLLQALGKENIERIDKTTATEIARKAKAKTMLLGSIFKWGNVIRVDYQLQDVAKGDWLVAAKVTGENPLTLADDLASHIRNNLGSSLSLSSARKIADVTTHSLEAYRYYLQGKDFESRYVWKEAWESYSKAIQFDSTFAMAYLGMWRWVADNAGRPQAERDSMLAKALRYAPRVSERERLCILADAAYYRGGIRDFRRISEELVQKYPTFAEFYERLGDYHYFRREYEKAIPHYRKWVELSNYSLAALGNLMVMFEKLNEADSAQYYFKKIQELYPNDAVTRELEHNHYLREGKIDQALTAARRSVAANPELPWSHVALGFAHFYADRFDSAEIEFHQVGLKGWLGGETNYMALTRLYQGKAASAIRFLEEKKRSKNENERWWAYGLELNLCDLLGEKEKARTSWLESKAHLYSTWLLSQKRGGDTFLADSLLWLTIPEAYYLGNTSKALSLCDRLQQEISQSDLGGGYAFDRSRRRAGILYAAGRFHEASDEYHAVVQDEPRISHRHRLAHCYHELKRYQEAKNILVQIRKTDDIQFSWVEIDLAHAYPRTFYLLGQVNEALGDAAGAMKAYQQFLEIWKEADKDLPELVDAKAMVAKLSGVQQK